MPEDGRKADLKLVLVGHSGVGKTAIVTRLTKNIFCQANDITLGASFFMKEWRGLLVAVWDTAGSEKFAPLTSWYLRRSDAALVVYDVTDQKSFERAKVFWKQLEDESPNCVVSLICNKMDLISQSDAIGMCSNGRSLASEKRATFFEASAKTGWNVEEAFDSLCSRVFPDIAGSKSASPRKAPKNYQSGFTIEAGTEEKSKCC
eukprot:m.332942 g.332942  ORF g.332942 m.332942 type:complete len:204 (+) comp17034_c0_seq1:118-729(+)